MTELERYGVPPKKSVGQKISDFFNNLWNKTVFPEKLAQMREEKAMKREIEREARMEALTELKPALKEAYIQKEKDKITGKKKKDMMAALAKGFGAGEDGKGMNTDAKLKMMLGGSGSTPDISKHFNDVPTNTPSSSAQHVTTPKVNKASSFGDTDRLNELLGLSSNQKKDRKKVISNHEDKIREMLK